MSATPASDQEAPAGNGVRADETALTAVGIPLGSERFGDESPGSVIYLSGEFYYVDQNTYMVWIGALAPRTLPELIAYCHESGVADPDGTIRELQDATLLEFFPEVGERESWMAVHRLVPCGLGRGNLAEDHSVFVIGDSSGALLAAVGPTVYNLWAVSTRCASLAAAVERTAEDRDTDPQVVATALFDALPVLLAVRACHLDRA
jgi:hypothetical protein